MARPSSVVQQRQLTATEELEKLEQSITLTLQGKNTAPLRWAQGKSRLTYWRNRPQLQSRTPHCHLEHLACC
jgi:hypothetical protein